jgi:SpoVK/Ycf46/Vps4 family AAA+-type ATPase
MVRAAAAGGRVIVSTTAISATAASAGGAGGAGGAEKLVKRPRGTDGEAIKLLPKLLEAVQWNRPAQAMEIGGQIATLIADRYPAVARSLQRNLAARPAAVIQQPVDLVDVRVPRHGFDAVVVPAAVATECQSMVAEHSRRDELAAYALEPRHKVLLHGPPGNGKTMLAEALAHELSVPFLVVRYAGLMESFLGATGKNIDKVLAYASSGPCVLFLDEFDGIGMDRGRAGDVGELRRVTNQLLIAVERLPSHVLLVCATNALDLVDAALRRRFDFPVELGAPSEDLRRRCAERELDVSITGGHDVRALAGRVAAIATENLSEVTLLCRKIRRHIALHGVATVEASGLLDRSGAHE